jgi:hypothetical protein
MSFRFRRAFITLWLCIGTGLASAAASAAAPATFTPEQLRADLSELEAGLDRIHPDVTHSVDRQSLARAMADVRARLDHPMTAHEAWTVMSSLNAVMSDGHLAVSYPGGSAAELQRHLAADGRLFPFAVHVTESGSIYVRGAPDGSATPLAGMRIDTIEDRPADAIASTLLAHVNGDSPAMRAALLSDRFAFYYWKFHGAPRHFTLGMGGVAVGAEASNVMPPAYREKSFEELFRLELSSNDAAVLTIDEFFWRDKAKFYEFTRDAFARLRAAGTRKLIIDLRANTGGDDDVWLEGLMPYLATKPFRNGSTWLLKVIEGRQKEGQKAGDVIRGSQETEYAPQPENPLRFSGKVYVLISPKTYSSAVLFSTAMQDNRFGTIVGVGGGARATQSGGIQTVRLPHTQINLVVPRFVLTRASGRAGLLQPDILVVDDPFRPASALEAVLRLD